MKKKILTFILALCFFLPCAFFVGCGPEEKEPKPQEFTGEVALEKVTNAIDTTVETASTATKFEISGTLAIDLNEDVVDFVGGLVEMFLPEDSASQAPQGTDPVTEEGPLDIVKQLLNGDDITYNVAFDSTNGAYVKLVDKTGDYKIEVLYNMTTSKINIALIAGDEQLFLEHTIVDEEPEPAGEGGVEDPVDEGDTTSEFLPLEMFNTFKLTLKDNAYTLDFDFDVDLVELVMGLMAEEPEEPGEPQIIGEPEGPEFPFTATLSVAGKVYFNNNMMLTKVELGATVDMHMDLEEPGEGGIETINEEPAGEGDGQVGEPGIFESIMMYVMTEFQTLFDEDGNLDVIEIAFEANLKLNDAVTTAVPTALDYEVEDDEWIPLMEIVGEVMSMVMGGSTPEPTD